MHRGMPVTDSTPAWIDGVERIESFFGEPLSESLVALVSSMPDEQWPALFEVLSYDHPDGGWTGESRLEVRGLDRAVTAFPDTSRFSGRGHEQTSDDLESALLYFDTVAIEDPICLIAQRIGHRWYRHELRPTLRLDLATVLLQMIALLPLRQSGAISLVRPLVHLVEIKAVSDDPLCAELLSPTLNGFIAAASNIYGFPPSEGQGWIQWEESMGGSDIWEQASYMVLGSARPARSEGPPLSWLVAVNTFARLNELTPVFTSDSGRRYAARNHEASTGTPTPIELGVPLLNLDLEKAAAIRSDELVFDHFRSAFRALMAVTDPGLDGPRQALAIQEAAQDMLQPAVDDLTRLRAKSSAIQLALPVVGSAALGLAVGAATGSGSGVARAVGRNLGSSASRRSTIRTRSADQAVATLRNLLMVGRL